MDNKDQKSSWHYDVTKRVMDVTLSGAALLLLSPLFLLIALAIRLQDGGPVFFWQDRVGKEGVRFRCPKFRSMIVNAEEIRRKLAEQNHHGANGVTFKMKRDPRITSVGAILRRFSLDELPQFWSVFVGDMSLVGPRPALPIEVERYTPTEYQRLSVLPGITCIWQVSGRADVPFVQQVEMDMHYIAQRSIVFDISLLLRTIPAILGGKGAY